MNCTSCGKDMGDYHICPYCGTQLGDHSSLEGSAQATIPIERPERAYSSDNRAETLRSKLTLLLGVGTFLMQILIFLLLLMK